MEAKRFFKWLKNAPDKHCEVGFLIWKLRTYNPFIFEAILLECCRMHGYCIQSEHKFKKDGGVDGKFSSKGRFYVIQAKLYKGEANPEHITMFSNAIEWQQASRGFFFHTGKADAQFWSAVKKSARVTVVSGEKLVEFLLGEYELLRSP